MKKTKQETIFISSYICENGNLCSFSQKSKNSISRCSFLPTRCLLGINKSTCSLSNLDSSIHEVLDTKIENPRIRQWLALRCGF